MINNLRALFTSDYRTVLREVITNQKRLKLHVNSSQLAENIGVQRAYLSKVFAKRAHLSADQMYQACRFLKLSDLQTRLFGLALEHARSANSARKRELMDEMESLERQSMEVSERIPVKKTTAREEDYSEYYLDPLVPLVHMFLSIPRYASDPKKIAVNLGLDFSRVQTSLSTLLRLSLIESKNGAFKLLKDHLHLPRTSPLYGAHQALNRQQSAQRIQSNPSANNFGLAVKFTANEATRKEIHEQLLQLTRALHKSVEKAPSEEVYELSIDFFSWS